MHLTIDGYRGDPSSLANDSLVQTILETLPPVIQMTKISQPVVCHYAGENPLDWGISGFVLIAESHISIHTFPERGYVWADIFSCKGFDSRGVGDVFIETFRLAEVRTRRLDRGLEFSDAEAWAPGRSPTETALPGQPSYPSPELVEAEPDSEAIASMLELIDSFRVSQALYVAVQLGIPDLLAESARHYTNLARASGTQEQSLLRLLRTLASVGILHHGEQDVFSLTPLGATLRSEAPVTLKAWANYVLGHETFRSWGDLAHSVRTGETAFEHVFGQEVWAYRSQNADYGETFDAAMRSLGSVLFDSVLDRYEFPKDATVIDVGGGDASFISAVLFKYRDARGVVLDLPRVAATARQTLQRLRLSRRCEARAGNFLEAVPAAEGIYVLCRVLQDWDDEAAMTILTNCRRAMIGQSKLILIERMLPVRMEASRRSRAIAVNDLTMLVMNGGKERREQEYLNLLTATGFGSVRSIETTSELTIMEAAPA